MSGSGSWLVPGKSAAIGSIVASRVHVASRAVSASGLRKASEVCCCCSEVETRGSLGGPKAVSVAGADKLPAIQAIKSMYDMIIAQIDERLLV